MTTPTIELATLVQRVQRERPILMSAPMVRATLRDDDPKTQTRRVIRAFKHADVDGVVHDCIKDDDGLPSRLDLALANWDRCPYGVPGDRLWVRETWCQPYSSQCYVLYRADMSDAQIAEARAVTREVGARNTPWRPSIFMPRWASRITLEITRVRVQRLCHITEDEATAEGITPDADCITNHCRRPHYDRFLDLWNEINGKRSGCTWQDNPWVWAITFRRITP